MIRSLAIAAALLLPGMAAARDVAELECLRDAATVADGAILFEAVTRNDAAMQKVINEKLVAKGVPCALRYRWTGPDSRAGGRYYGATLLLAYSQSEMAKRPGAIEKLDAALAALSPESRARLGPGGTPIDADRDWLGAQVMAVGLSPADLEGKKALLYLVSTIQRAKYVEDWKAL